MASQSGSYAALLAGGVLAVAGFSGHSLKDVLAGRSSPLKGLISEPPTPGTAGGSLIPAGYVPGGKAQGNNQAQATLGASGYVYPFGAGWTEERVDQGQDFAPSHTGAPILAPGNAKVTKIGAPGWPSGGKGVLLELLDGPLKGKHIFIYEAIHPTVAAGQIVRAGQQIGYGVFGETGIEIGFADANGVPLSHAEYTEGKETIWGKKIKAFLQALKGQKKTKVQFHPRSV